MYSLYLITNTINRKRYAGITSQPIQQRFTQHCTQGRHLTNAILKYGRENFSLELVSSSDNLELIKSYEIVLINSLCLTDRTIGYNLSDGGDLAAKTETTKIKISKKLKGIPKSEAHRVKIRASAVKRGLKRRGKKRPAFSEEWKMNMRKGREGLKLSSTHKEAISRGIRNSEKYATADKGIYFRTNNPSNDPILKERIARAKWKPVYCVNNKICYLSLKSAAEHLGLRPSSVATALFRCKTIGNYKFYYIYT